MQQRIKLRILGGLQWNLWSWLLLLLCLLLNGWGWRR
jgi:hypothetical protein